MGISTKIALLAVTLAGTATVYGQYPGGGTGRGQHIEAFRNGLAEPGTLSTGSVRVTEHGSAADVVYSYDSAGHPASVEGYRVRIFVDNGQDAGDNSAAVQEMFREKFPAIPTYRSYESPSWIVAVGNCVTMEEALILQNKVKDGFKIALPWKGEIPIAEFLNEGDELPAGQEEEL